MKLSLYTSNSLMSKNKKMIAICLATLMMFSSCFTTTQNTSIYYKVRSVKTTNDLRVKFGPPDKIYK